MLRLNTILAAPGNSDDVQSDGKIRAEAGVFIILAAAPADASLRPNEFAFYLDEGNTKIAVKGKYDDGTVVTGDVATLT